MKQVFSSCIPPVRSGETRLIKVFQELDGRLTQAGPNTVHVRIDGPQTALLPDMISGVYPRPGSETSPDEFLPHIAPTRRTLPWERQGPVPDPDVPWLVLLLFKESELRSPEQRKQVPAVSVIRQKVGGISDLVTLQPAAQHAADFRGHGSQHADGRKLDPQAGHAPCYGTAIALSHET